MFKFKQNVIFLIKYKHIQDIKNEMTLIFKHFTYGIFIALYIIFNMECT